MISDAAEGVGALKSATISLIVISVSCPTADTIGMEHFEISLARFSSLKGQRSSNDPPPLPIIKISMSPSFENSLIPAMISFDASDPWTKADRIIILICGARLLKIVNISLRAAPVSDVIIPIVEGNLGSIFFRDSSKRPSSFSRFFDFSNSKYRAPMPAGSICWTII